MEILRFNQYAAVTGRVPFARAGPSRSSPLPLSAAHYPAPTQSEKQLKSCPDVYEKRLRQLETEAQEKFKAAIEDLPQVKPADWFMRLLDESIIPAFTRIGFDETIARTLFQMAAPGWQKMGPITKECVWFHPAIMKDIREIRSGIISKSESASSWMILPRAYHPLKKHHSRCLPGYLKFLDKETNSEFRKLLVRIIIEFTGNYTFKYLSEILPQRRMVSAIFNGYAAMFWKTLRNPPQGFEDDLICCHFLRWAKLFRRRCTALKHDMAKTIKQMEEKKQKVMPGKNFFHLTDHGHDDYEKFLITLRHGRPGIDAVIGYMGICTTLFGNITGGRIPYAAVPAALTELFQTIKRKYPTETPATQKNIREFLRRLTANYASNCINGISNRGKSSEPLRFVVPRVRGLVEGITASFN
jgi:hypothetical protein